jgi:hypothetical protein
MFWRLQSLRTILTLSGNKLYQWTCCSGPTFVSHYPGRARPKLRQGSSERFRVVDIGAVRRVWSSSSAISLSNHGAAMEMVLYSWLHCQCTGNRSLLLFLLSTNIRKEISPRQRYLID